MRFSVVFSFVLVHCTWINISAATPDSSSIDRTTSNDSSLSRAISQEDFDAVQKLFSDGHGITNDVLNESLIKAASLNNIQIVNLLIKSGADVNVKDSKQETPFHKVAFSGSADIAELLLTNGADINAKNELGLTPLHLATKHGSKHMVDFLIDHGCNVNATDIFGDTALYLIDADQDEIAELLIKNGGINVNAVNLAKGTGLHRAAFYGQPKVVKLLLQNGADRSLLNKDGKTALDLAEAENKKQVDEFDIKDYEQVIELLKAN